jgi:hypothetical protein
MDTIFCDECGLESDDKRHCQYCQDSLCPTCFEDHRQRQGFCIEKR